MTLNPAQSRHWASLRGFDRLAPYVAKRLGKRCLRPRPRQTRYRDLERLETCRNIGRRDHGVRS